MTGQTIHDRKPAAYDLFVGRWSPGFAPRLLELAAVGPGHRVLDVGTGTGAAALAAAERVGATGQVVGIDLADNMIEGAIDKAAQRSLLNVSFRKMDAMTLDFPDATLDAVVSLLGAMYWPDPVAALREQYRVLVPGGRIAAAVWGTAEEVPFAGVLWQVVARHIPEAEEEARIGFRYGDEPQLPDWFAAAGFTDVTDEQVSVPTVYQSFEEYWSSVEAGGGRATRFLKAQREAVRASIRDEVQALLAPAINQQGLVLQATARILAAQRPA